ncbi:MAG: phosphate-starvation-inducible PsiE family protein [Nitrospiria bacterium]
MDPQKNSNNLLGNISAEIMEKSDKIIYLMTGISFLIIGVAAFIYSWTTFASELRKGFLHSILTLINNLLLVMIIMEILRTIINYLKSQDILLEPFLYIGIIAATRKMLTAGAEISFMEMNNDQIFYRYLLDLGINALVVVALSIALYLIGRRKRQTVE